MRPNGRIIPGLRGNGSVSFELSDNVMLPTHAHLIQVHMIPHMDYDSLTVDIKLEVDNESTTLHTHRYTEDDLANAYEIIHHRVHGYDARGLDPREGKTRLTI